MKKILIIFLLLFNSLGAIAQENSVELSLGAVYLLLINEPDAIFSIYKPEILSATKMNTLSNDKQQVIVQPKAVGQTIFEIISDGDYRKYNVTVVEERTPFHKDFIEIDTPYRKYMEE